MKIFDEFLCPFGSKHTDDSFCETDPAYERDDDGPVTWPLIEEEYVANTNHDSEKSWKYE